MSERLASIQVITPLFCIGDVIGKLSSVGAWVDAPSIHGDSGTVLARLPKSAIANFERWLAETSKGRGSCFVVTGEEN